MAKQQQLWIAGPVGRLETLYVPAQGMGRGVAVINHPNPLQGGLNTNKVVQTAAKALSQLGFHCYLPNFRGVGLSDGQHDYGRGEVVDCLAVADYARAQHPQATQFVLSGFSFGGYVALFAARTAKPDALLLIAPAVGKYTVPAPPAFDALRTLLIQGEDDDVIPLKNGLVWAAEQGMPVVVVPGAGHFFHGQLMLLRQWIVRLLPALLASHNAD
ncbi:alpha/beta hydrolase [Snodgrassella sp. CFCC 13594]|uniref:alpha/beta hydrolase n=1 Tax=Snodgrassella sp. CFCC 13594 TaxID=1775559 RepID=UPI00350FD620